jgi:hypothetical protein
MEESYLIASRELPLYKDCQRLKNYRIIILSHYHIITLVLNCFSSKLLIISD